MIIAITNQKGGVGKTTTALNVSAGLAVMGEKNLLIETNPHANLNISFVENPSHFTKSLFDVLVNPDDQMHDIIAPSVVPGLDVCISKISMAKLEPTLLGEIDGHYRLKDKLKPIKSGYDYIVMDTPPTLGLITLNALVSADKVVIPIQSSYLCLEGTDDLLETIDKVKKIANPDLEILGVIITLHDKRTNIAKDVVERIKKVFGNRVFNTVISKSVKLEESPAYKESIFTFAPDSIGAVQYREVVKEIMNRA